MSTPTRLLIVSDRPQDLVTIPLLLRESGVELEVLSAACEDDFVTGLGSQPDAVLSRYRVGAFGALPALNLLRNRAPRIPLLVFDSDLDSTAYDECIRWGAYDVIPADRAERFGSTLRRALTAPSDISLAGPWASPTTAGETAQREAALYVFYRLRLAPDRAVERIDGDCPP